MWMNLSSLYIELWYKLTLELVFGHFRTHRYSQPRLARRNLKMKVRHRIYEPFSLSTTSQLFSPYMLYSQSGDSSSLMYRILLYNAVVSASRRYFRRYLLQHLQSCLLVLLQPLVPPLLKEIDAIVNSKKIARIFVN